MFKKITRYALLGSMIPMLAGAQTMSLEERVAELEANSSLNIFKFSGTMITRYDDIIKAEQTDPNSVLSPAFDNKDLSYLRMKFQFNVDAEVSKNIKFYSRFTMSKHFNAFYKSGSEASTTGSDLAASNSYSGPQVVVEKAYADFAFPDTDLVLSVGRLPTVDGQPQNFKDGRARMGTYPMMSYDSVLDGFALTYKMDRMMPTDNKLALRLVYTPFSQYNLASPTQPPTDDADHKVNTQVSTIAAQVDYGVSNLSWADSVGVVLQHFQTGDIYYPNETGQAFDSTLNIAVGGTTLATEFMGIGGTGLDISASYLLSSLKSMGSFGPLGGYGTNSSDDTLTGGIFLLSGRYRLSSWILGLEYLNGSEDSFFYAANDETLTSFYSTKGDAYHLYVTKKFGQNLALRIGYMDQAYKYTSGIGATVGTDKKIQTGYANLRLDF